MTRTSRFRTKSLSQTGTVDLFIGATHATGFPQTSTITRTSSMTDSHGRPVTPSGLDATSWEGDGISFSGDSFYGSGATKYNYKRDKFPAAVSSGSLLTEPIAAKSGWLLDTIAGTNPSRPVMTPPTLLQDFVTIPSMLRETGKLITKPRSLMSAKEVANHYLCAQFGYLPLVEDITQLLDLQSYVLKRNKELHDLYSGKGLKRRIRFEEDNQVGVGSVAVAAGPSGQNVRGVYEIHVERKNWATIHWYPTTPPPYHPDDARWNKLARQLVLGLTVEGLRKGLWDVLPWTWLLGWFTNVGKYLMVNSNTVPAQHSDGCLMRQSITSYIPTQTARDSGVTGDCKLVGSLRRKRMTRTVSSAITPGINMPHLDMFRLSILSALFVQRLK